MPQSTLATFAESGAAYAIIDASEGLEKLSGDAAALAKIKALIADETVVILRSAFNGSLVEKVRKGLHGWGASQELMPPQTVKDENFHAIEHGVSPRQKTLHFYHGYNLNQLEKLPSDLRETCLKLYEPMRAFYNVYTGFSGGFGTRDAEGKKLHPQAIHYPTGGGYLATHIHPKDPQAIGLIVHGTQKGRDYTSGGTGFQTRHGSVDTDDLCSSGDMIVFNYGLLHWVTPCDIEQRLDKASINGRWVFTLPYN